jgi:hypothetical protein
MMEGSLPLEEPNSALTADVQGGSNLNRETFEQEIRGRFRDATNGGSPYIDIASGDIHRSVGGYPGTNHRMPICCSVMRRLMKSGDVVLASPPRGQGATLTIRYGLPR